MMVAGLENPNASWLNDRGVWLTYILLIAILHFILLSMPFLSVPVVWTATFQIHNILMFIFMHYIKGTPWEGTDDQGRFRLLTLWEQMDDGVQLTPSRKFFTVCPIILFFITTFYTKYDSTHFFINLVSLMFVLVPKLPQFHGVRLFGINKY